jgi:nitroreductase
MLLEITEHGLASCWIEGQVTAEAETQKKIGALIGAPEDLTVVAWLPVGFPEKEIRHPAYKPFSEWAFFNGYGKIK